MRSVTVSPELTPMAWPLVERWVREALIEGKADLSPASVKAKLRHGSMQLWLAWDDTGRRAKGCCVTEFAESVRGTCCNLVVVAGIDFPQWRSLIDDVKDWARQRGCVRLEAGGREGWLRLVKSDGWCKLRTVIEMRLDGNG